MPGDKSNDSGGIQVHVLEQHKNGHIHIFKCTAVSRAKHVFRCRRGNSLDYWYRILSVSKMDDDRYGINTR